MLIYALIKILPSYASYAGVPGNLPPRAIFPRKFGPPGTGHFVTVYALFQLKVLKMNKILDSESVSITG